MWLINKQQMDEYISSCLSFANDDHLFSYFKSRNEYCRIVAMNNEDQGRAWSDKIKNDLELCEKIDIFKKNDICNPPNLYYDNNLGYISPSTIRYIYNVYNIKRLFAISQKDISKVIEIGAGYGGMAYISSNYFNLQKYYIVDLPEVKKMCDKYLKKLNVSCHSFVEDNEEKYDLLVAEYSFTEFDDEQMNYFYEKYFLKSDRLYLVVNFCENEKDQARRIQWLNKIKENFDVIVEDEYPKSQYQNYIWACTRKQ